MEDEHTKAFMVQINTALEHIKKHYGKVQRPQQKTSSERAKKISEVALDSGLMSKMFPQGYLNKEPDTNALEHYQLKPEKGVGAFSIQFNRLLKNYTLKRFVTFAEISDPNCAESLQNPSTMRICLRFFFYYV